MAETSYDYKAAEALAEEWNSPTSAANEAITTKLADRTQGADAALAEAKRQVEGAK